MICIITIIKDEHQYICEWVDYHLKLGIDHIFILEDIYSKSHSKVLLKYKDRVSLIDINFIKKIQPALYRQRQHICFQEGIAWIKNNYNYDWCFVIDCDEYITLKTENHTLQQILQLYDEYDAVVLQWQNYNANGHIFKPDYSNKGVVKTYTQKCGKLNKDFWVNCRKVVYNLRTFKKQHFNGVHFCDHNIKWCKTDFSNNIIGDTFQNIYLRHYITKSFEEYINKVYVRGMFSKNHREFDDFFSVNPDMLDKKEELYKMVLQQINENDSRIKTQKEKSLGRIAEV